MLTFHRALVGRWPRLTGRVEFLQSPGYRIWTQVIPGEITPKNRLLIGASDDVQAGS